LPQVTLPPAAYTNPETQRPAIKTFVDTYVERLVNDADPVNQSTAREELSKAALEKGQPAQPPFLFEYARILNDALLARLKAPNASMRQRLNIAIVAQRVAQVAQNTALQNTVLALVQDKDEPVVMWGIKAAGPVINASVKIKPVGAAKPAPPPLLAAIVPTVLKHPSGEIYEEAYEALSMRDQPGDPLIVDELMKVWENRLLQYKAGAPDNASADAKPVHALTQNLIWNGVLKNPADRVKVMQMILDQISMAAQHADNPANKDKRDQLVSVVQKTAEGIVVVALNQKDAALQSAADPVMKLKPDQTPPGLKITPMVQPAVADAVLKSFPGVKPPQPAAAAGVAGQQQ
jgi:hypothetical protein